MNSLARSARCLAQEVLAVRTRVPSGMPGFSWRFKWVSVLVVLLLLVEPGREGLALEARNFLLQVVRQSAPSLEFAHSTQSCSVQPGIFRITERRACGKPVTGAPRARGASCKKAVRSSLGCLLLLRRATCPRNRSCLSSTVAMAGGMLRACSTKTVSKVAAWSTSK